MVCLLTLLTYSYNSPSHWFISCWAISTVTWSSNRNLRVLGRLTRIRRTKTQKGIVHLSLNTFVAYLTFTLTFIPLSICKTCPNYLRLLSLIISSNFCTAVFSLTFLLRTLSFQEMLSRISVAKICDLLLSTFSFMWQTKETTVLYCVVEHCWHNQRFIQSHVENQTNVFVLSYWLQSALPIPI